MRDCRCLKRHVCILIDHASFVNIDAARILVRGCTLQAVNQEEERKRRFALWLRAAIDGRPELNGVNGSGLGRLFGVAPTTPGTWLKASSIPQEPAQFDAIARVVKRPHREVLEAAGYIVDDDGPVKDTLSADARELVEILESLRTPAARGLLLSVARDIQGHEPNQE